MESEEKKRTTCPTCGSYEQLKHGQAKKSNKMRYKCSKLIALIQIITLMGDKNGRNTKHK